MDSLAAKLRKEIRLNELEERHPSRPLEFCRRRAQFASWFIVACEAEEIFAVCHFQSCSVLQRVSLNENTFTQLPSAHTLRPLQRSLASENGSDLLVAVVVVVAYVRYRQRRSSTLWDLTFLANFQCVDRVLNSARNGKLD